MTSWAPAHARQALEACVVVPVEGSAGTVDSVRDVPVRRDLHAFDAGTLEHSVQPELAEELVVRLDVGPVVVFTQREPYRLRAGQRVTVYLNGSIARVERHSCSALG